MKKRTALRAIAIFSAIFIAKKVIQSIPEWMREDRMREMSDEGPLIRVLPAALGQALYDEREFLRELVKLVVIFPVEIAKYLKSESM
jgi:hypothetical protein